MPDSASSARNFTAIVRGLTAAGVYDEPARLIADVLSHVPARDLLIAFRAHVAETGSINLAVWRLQRGQLRTGGQKVDAILRRQQQATDNAIRRMTR